MNCEMGRKRLENKARTAWEGTPYRYHQNFGIPHFKVCGTDKPEHWLGDSSFQTVAASGYKVRISRTTVRSAIKSS